MVTQRGMALLVGLFPFFKNMKIKKYNIVLYSCLLGVACIYVAYLHHEQKEIARLKAEHDKTKRELFETIFHIDSCDMDEIDTETLLYIVNIINRTN